MFEPVFDWCLDDGCLIIGVTIEGMEFEHVINTEDLLKGLEGDLLMASAERSPENLAELQEWSDYKMALRNFLTKADRLMTHGVREEE